MRRLLFIIAICALAGCGGVTKTIIPPTVVATQASFDGNRQTSGILWIDGGGYHVTAHYLERYDALLEKYGARLVPPVTTGDRRGITTQAAGEFNPETKQPEAAHYHFTAETRARFTLMNQWRKNGE